MPLFEALVIANLLISLFIAYRLGVQQGDVDTLYNGLALTMEKLGMTIEQDD